MSIQAEIIAWFKRDARDLPWRHKDVSAWNILVSEIMLQQTPAARVAPQWLAWIKRWPTVHDVSAAKPADILRQWDRLGYPNRALRLHAAAQQIVRDHSGVVPHDESQLRALPGIGEYTAAAICSFAYGHTTVVLDTNIRRVISRIWSGIDRPSQAISSVERALAQSLIPSRKPHSLQWASAVMEFGAVVCTATKPSCNDCFVRAQCTWRLAGYPISEQKRKSQKFSGTDRPVRGRIMKILRENPSSVKKSAFDSVSADVLQKERALNSLIIDGLVEVTKSGLFRLPH